MPSRLLKNHFDTGATQHSRRTGTASEQPAGWSKPVLSFAEGRPSSEAVASEEAKAYSVRYVEPPGAARTKLADPSTMLRPCFFNILLAGKGVLTALTGMVHLGRGFRMVPILEVPVGVPGC